MRFALIVEGVPAPDSAGSAMANWTVIEQAVGMGHDVYTLVLLTEFDREDQSVLSSRCDALRRAGAEVDTLPIPPPPSRSPSRWRFLRDLVDPPAASLYPSISLADEIERRLALWGADALYVFNYGPVAALHDRRLAPRLAVFGDPLHLVTRWRLRMRRRTFDRAYLHAVLEWLGVERTVPRWIVEIARPYERRAWLGAQHAAWLRRKGLQCDYLPVPVTDLAGDTLRRSAIAEGGLRKIVMIGGLSGTASRAGHAALAKTVLPALEREFGSSGFELHLIGGALGELPADLRRIADHPAVRIRGHVSDLRQDLLSADVFLLASRYPVGIRTRIVTAMSFGCCVVTDATARLGAPELVHEENVLIGDGAGEIAAEVVRAIGSPELRRRIGASARLTYERVFAPEAAARRVVVELERLGGRAAR